MTTNKLPANLFPAMYSHRIHEIVTIGRACGYAIAVHGSMQRDLDLIAIPWAPRALSPKTLVNRMCRDLGCKQAEGNPGKHAHGRLSYTLLLGGALWLDLSVMPRLHHIDLNPSVFKPSKRPIREMIANSTAKVRTYA